MQSAHPRSRGEHFDEQKNLHLDYGSSPLARGTHGDKARQWTGTRLIPARAGNTFMRLHTDSPPSAHPRSRGEHLSRLGAVDERAGSSPLARGTPAWRANLEVHGRLIPARAGNTRFEEAYF